MPINFFVFYTFPASTPHPAPSLIFMKFDEFDSQKTKDRHIMSDVWFSAELMFWWISIKPCQRFSWGDRRKSHLSSQHNHIQHNNRIENFQPVCVRSIGRWTDLEFGWMAQVNLWTHSLSHNSIQVIMLSCIILQSVSSPSHCPPANPLRITAMGPIAHKETAADGMVLKHL